MHHIVIDIARQLRAEVNQVINHSALLFIHKFDVAFEHQADFDLPPGLNVDSDGETGQELSWVWLSEQLGRVFGFDFTQNAGES
jgi:hypothetical protein